MVVFHINMEAKVGKDFCNIIGPEFTRKHLRLDLTRSQLDGEILELVASTAIERLPEQLASAAFWIKLTQYLSSLFTYQRKPISSSFKWEKIAKRFLLVICPNVSKVNQVHAEKLKLCLDQIFASKQFCSMNDLLTYIYSNRETEPEPEPGPAVVEHTPPPTSITVSDDEPPPVVVGDDPQPAPENLELDTVMSFHSDSSLASLVITEEDGHFGHQPTPDRSEVPEEPVDANKTDVESNASEDISENTARVIKDLAIRADPATHCLPEIKTKKSTKRIKLSSDVSAAPSNSDHLSITEESYWMSAADEASIGFDSFRQKKLKVPYTNEEDAQILSYIVKTNRFDEVKGNELWKQMENEQVCPQRSWQSLRNRFLKTILPNVGTYAECLNIKQRIMENFQNCNLSITGSDANDSTCSGVTRKNANGQTNQYTPEEDEEIFQMVLLFSSTENLPVKGRLIWEKISKQFHQILKRPRSWQGLKERFQRRILPNIHRKEVKSLEQLRRTLWIIEECSRFLPDATQTKKLLLQQFKRRNPDFDEENI